MHKTKAAQVVLSSSLRHVTYYYVFVDEGYSSNFLITKENGD